MADLYGYMYIDNTDGTSVAKIRLRSQDGSVAVNDAIDAEAKQKGTQYVTNARAEVKTEELNFDKVMKNFEDVIGKISAKAGSDEAMATVWAPKITQVTEKYLGKGKKVANATRDQVEQLSLIVFDFLLPRIILFSLSI